MLDYVIALRGPYGEIESVYFEDEFANNYDCTLVGKTTYDSCYKLSSMNISITKLHPVITFKKAGIVNIQYISIFKDKASELVDASKDRIASLQAKKGVKKSVVEIINEYVQSGQTVKEFCEERNINGVYAQILMDYEQRKGKVR